MHGDEGVDKRAPSAQADVPYLLPQESGEWMRTGSGCGSTAIVPCACVSARQGAKLELRSLSSDLVGTLAKAPWLDPTDRIPNHRSYHVIPVRAASPALEPDILYEWNGQ